MFAPRTLVLSVAVLLSGCASSAAAATLRSSSSATSSKEREVSLLQLSFGGLRAVAEAQAEVADARRHQVTGDEDGQSGAVVFVLGFILGSVVCGLLPICGYGVARALGKRIERGVEASTLLGVDIDVGKLSVHLLEGYILVHGLTVFNPPGYSAEYLLKAETVSVDVRMATLVCSCFRTVQVEKIVFSGIDVLHDRSWSSSNIHDVINSASRDKGSEKGREAGAKCIMRKVLFEDVVVREAAAGKASVALASADLDMQDFSAESGESLVHVAASDILRRVLKTAAANVAGSPVTVERVSKQ